MASADADVVIKLNVHDVQANAALTAFEARLKKLDSAGSGIGGHFDDLANKVDNFHDSLQEMDKTVNRLEGKSFKDLDKELGHKKRDFDRVDKSVNKTDRSMRQHTKSVDEHTSATKKGHDALKRAEKGASAFGAMIGRVGKFVKFAGIEFGVMSAAVGGLSLALKAGHLLLRAWQATLTGVGMAAGTAVAGLSAFLAATREYQYAMMLPRFKAAGTPLTGATNARSRMGAFVGDAQLAGAFSGKAINATFSGAMARGAKPTMDTRQMIKALSNFAIASGAPDKTLPGLVNAFAATSKTGGKLTADSYKEIASQSADVAKVFEELAGGPKELEKAIKAGKISVDDFMNAFREGKLKSVQPFLTALKDVDDTLIGRFKSGVTKIKERLIDLGTPIAEALKNPLADLERNLKVFVARIAPTLQRTFGDMFGGNSDLMDRFFRRLATMINESVPKIVTLGEKFRSGINWVKDFFGKIGDYIRSATTGAGTLWKNIIKPLGSEVLKTIDFAIKQFNSTINKTDGTSKNFADRIRDIGETVRGLVKGLATMKEVLAPIVDMFLKLLGAFKGLANNKLLGALLVTGLLGKKIGGGMPMTNRGRMKQMAQDMRETKNFFMDQKTTPVSGVPYLAGQPKPYTNVQKLQRTQGQQLINGNNRYVPVGAMMRAIAQDDADIIQRKLAGQPTGRIQKVGSTFLTGASLGMAGMPGQRKFGLTQYGNRKAQAVGYAAAEAERNVRLQRQIQRQQTQQATFARMTQGMYFDDEMGAYFKGNQPMPQKFGDHYLPQKIASQLKFDPVMNDYTFNGKLVDDKFYAKHGLTQDQAIQQYGGKTLAQMKQSARDELQQKRPQDDYVNRSRGLGRDAARDAGKEQAKAFNRESATKWAKSAGKQLGSMAPMAAGLAATYIGGIISSRADKTNQAKQAIGGGVAMAGQGAMMGAAFGPWGALAGGLIGGGIGAVTSWMNAGKARERRREEATNKAREYGTSLLVTNDRKSIDTQRAQNKRAIAALQAYGGKETDKKALEDDITRIMNAGDYDTRDTSGQSKADKYIRKRRHEMANIRSHKAFLDEEGIFGNFKQEDTIKHMNRLLEANKNLTAEDRAKGVGLTKEQVQTFQKYIDLQQEQDGVNKIAGKSLDERLAAEKELNKVDKELAAQAQRFDTNLQTLASSMGMSGDEAQDFANRMNIDLAKSFVTLDTVLQGLGYTTDKLANRATAAGRFLDEVLKTLEQPRKRIEADQRYDAVGQALFNTKKFSTSYEAQLAAADVVEAFVERQTAKRNNPNEAAYNMSAVDYMKNTQEGLESLLKDYADSPFADKNALSQLQELVYGSSPFRPKGMNDADYALMVGLGGGQMPGQGGGVGGIVQKNMGTFSGRLATDEQFATGLNEQIKKLTDDAVKAYQASVDQLTNMGKVDEAKNLSPEAFIQNAYNKLNVDNNPLFKGINMDEKARTALKGYIISGMEEGANGLDTAFKTGAADIASALSKVTLSVKGQISGTLTSSTGDTMTVNATLGSSGGGVGGGSPSSVDNYAYGINYGNAADTRTSRFGRTMAAHNMFNGMLPGKRTITSGIRDFNLGSPSSDHRFGRAYDLVGDNLGQYANMVNDSGGFAEFHGSAGSRHLHVVPPIGDSASPAGGGGGGTYTQVYNINVSAGGGADADAIADAVHAKIKKLQQSDAERR